MSWISEKGFRNVGSVTKAFLLRGRTRVSRDLLLVSDTWPLPPPGLGDMAVSNTIGSNVFDILVGLGIPWGLQTMVINYGSTVSSSSLLSKRARRQARAFHGKGGAVGLSQPAALGATLPASPWHPSAHCPRRLPEQPEGCLQGKPHESCPHPVLLPRISAPAESVRSWSFPQTSRVQT